MYYLMLLKLVSLLFNVVFISLNGLCRIKIYILDGDNVINDLLFDIYVKCEKYVNFIFDIMVLNFIDFVIKYKIVNNKLLS